MLQELKSFHLNKHYCQSATASIFIEISKSKCPGGEVHQAHGSIIYEHSTKGRGWTCTIIQFIFRHLMKHFQECSTRMLPENFTKSNGEPQVSLSTSLENTAVPHRSLAKSYNKTAEQGGSRQAWFSSISAILPYSSRLSSCYCNTCRKIPCTAQQKVNFSLPCLI